MHKIARRPKLSVFEKFGGIRPMASKLGVPSSTVKSWHVKREIPGWRYDHILHVAASHKIPLARKELAQVRPDSGVALCGTCDRRAEAPDVSACTAVDCGLRQKEAA